MLNSAVFSTAFKDLKLLCDELEPFAKRNKISAFAAVMLIALNENADLSMFFKEDYQNELITNGFAELFEEKLTITGKGAIFVKSLNIVVQKFESKKYK